MGKTFGKSDEDSSLDKCRNSFLNDAGVVDIFALRELVRFIVIRKI
jgi:hypothetical protein